MATQVLYDIDLDLAAGGAPVVTPTSPMPSQAGEEPEQRQPPGTLATLRKANSSGNVLDMSMFPKELQEFLGQFDDDGNMQLSRAEMSTAFLAMKSTQAEKKILSRMLVGSIIVIVVLVASVFGVSIVAGELVKEVKVLSGRTPTLVSLGGIPVQVSSADFEVRPDGTLAARSSPSPSPTGGSDGDAAPGEAPTATPSEANPDGTIKVSVAETARRIASTLPTEAFKKLKYITLQDESGDVSLGVQILGFRRVRVRTSSCGSVVQLETKHGRITIDDYEIMFDEEFETYATAAGLGSSFHEGALQAFGRRLTAATELTGFFDSFPDGWSQQCTSEPLEPPEQTKGVFLAKAVVRHRMHPGEKTHSKLFGAGGQPLLLAGVVKEGERFYATWHEEAIGGVLGATVTMRRYPMYPLSRFLAFSTKGGKYKAKLTMEGGDVVKCHGDGDPVQGNATDVFGEEMMRNLTLAALLNESAMGNFTVNGTSGSFGRLEAPPVIPSLFEFVDIEEVDGILVRHFRLYLQPQDGGNNDSAVHVERDVTMDFLMSGGSIPNVYDYWDVDTDPTGLRAPGSPYKRVSWSTVPQSRVYVEITYTSVEPLADNLTVADALSMYGVRTVPDSCLADLHLDFNDSKVAVEATVQQLKDQLGSLEMTEQVPLPYFWPPKMELAAAVSYQKDLLFSQGPGDARLQWALSFEYWSHIKDMVDDADLVLSKYSIFGVPGHLKGNGSLSEDGEEAGPEAENEERRLDWVSYMHVSRRRRSGHGEECEESVCYYEGEALDKRFFSIVVPGRGPGSDALDISCEIKFPLGVFASAECNVEGGTQTDLIKVGCYRDMCAWVKGHGLVRIDDSGITTDAYVDLRLKTQNGDVDVTDTMVANLVPQLHGHGLELSGFTGQSGQRRFSGQSRRLTYQISNVALWQLGWMKMAEDNPYVVAMEGQARTTTSISFAHKKIGNGAQWVSDYSAVHATVVSEFTVTVIMKIPWFSPIEITSFSMERAVVQY